MKENESTRGIDAQRTRLFVISHNRLRLVARQRAQRERERES